MSTPIIGDTLLAAIIALLTKIWITLLASKVLGILARIAMVGVAAYVFYEFFWVVEAKVAGAMSTAFANLSQASGTMGDATAFAGCMLPTSLSEAFTMMLNIYVFAATVKLTRIFLLAKVSG